MLAFSAKLIKEPRDIEPGEQQLTTTWMYCEAGGISRPLCIRSTNKERLQHNRFGSPGSRNNCRCPQEIVLVVHTGKMLSNMYSFSRQKMSGRWPANSLMTFSSRSQGLWTSFRQAQCSARRWFPTMSCSEQKNNFANSHMILEAQMWDLLCSCFLTRHEICRENSYSSIRARPAFAIAHFTSSLWG